MPRKKGPTRFFLKSLVPAWYGMTGGFESLSKLKYRKRAKKELKEAKERIKTTIDLAAWYKETGIYYKRDKLDCGSYPWVTVAKGCGDCEDFMLLSYAIMKDKAKCYKAFCYGRTDKGKIAGHAILVVKENDEWVLMSNQYRRTGFTSRDDAAKHHFADKTISFYFMKKDK